MYGSLDSSLHLRAERCLATLDGLFSAPYHSHLCPLVRCVYSWNFEVRLPWSMYDCSLLPPLYFILSLATQIFSLEGDRHHILWGVCIQVISLSWSTSISSLFSSPNIICPKDLSRRMWKTLNCDWPFSIRRGQNTRHASRSSRTTMDSCNRCVMYSVCVVRSLSTCVCVVWARVQRF